METLRSSEEKHHAQREGILMFLSDMFFVGNGTAISLPDAKRIFHTLLSIQGDSVIHTHFPMVAWYCANRIVDLVGGQGSVHISHEVIALMTQNWLKFRYVFAVVMVVCQCSRNSRVILLRGSPANKGVAFLGVIAVVLDSTAFTVDSPEELVHLRSSLARCVNLWRNVEVAELRSLHWF